MSLERPVCPDPYELLPATASFDVRSDDVTAGQPLKDDQVASGGNTSPHLAWSGAPEGTKGFWSPASTPTLRPRPASGTGPWSTSRPTSPSCRAGAGSGDDALPGNAFHVRNDGGSRDFTGAAPPEGDQVHRYYFVVHALDTDSLGVDGDASPTFVAFNMLFHTLGRAIVQGTYQH